MNKDTIFVNALRINGSDLHRNLILNHAGVRLRIVQLLERLLDLLDDAICIVIKRLHDDDKCTAAIGESTESKLIKQTQYNSIGMMQTLNRLIFI